LSRILIGISRNLRYNKGILGKIVQNIFSRSKGLILLSLLTFFFLNGPSLAQEISEFEKYQERDYGPEYFAAIQGEVYGQAAPGVQAVYVNSQRVSIDKNLNFRTKVFLKKGQKYLEIETRYRGLRFIKKYLVIRHPKAKKTFQIHVPKKEFQKIISKARPAVAKKPPPTPPPKPKASFGFKEQEFKDRYNYKLLANAIKVDNYGIQTKSSPGTLKYINEILRRPDFYEKWKAKNKKIIMTEEILRLIKETEGYRDQPFDKLTKLQQQKIIRLNRLLIEATYPFLAPKSHPEGVRLVEDEKWLGFEFVAELEPGKLLAIRRVNGKYFGLILDTRTNIWLHLHEITHEEMKDFLEKGKLPSSFNS
jgi:hypothetical protein